MSIKFDQMSDIFALVDCNNFYVSCERVFNPLLKNKAVVVMSNNDGCVIARSDEAKALGIKMGQPVFEIGELIRKNNVFTFSTNYTLYGDISERVMNCLTSMVPEVEIYSIDEAFLDLSFVPQSELISFGRKLKETVWQWTGIPVSVGIGKSKTLAKTANHLAKQKPEYQGVLSLAMEKDCNKLLKSVPVEEVWGVGEKYKAFFHRSGIYSAHDLKTTNEFRLREKLGVAGQRISLELRGISCYPLNFSPDTKKEVCSSRSFGQPLSAFDDLVQAATTYVEKVAEKLRKQKTRAGSLLVFVMTNKYASGPKYVNYQIVKLPHASNQTSELIHYTVIALKKIFRSGFKYKKTGVIASDLIPDTGFQDSLWQQKNNQKQIALQHSIDEIHNKMGSAALKFGIQGNEDTFGMRQENLSPRYTTRWDELLEVGY